jgi:hypothetical protein
MPNLGQAIHSITIVIMLIGVIRTLISIRTLITGNITTPLPILGNIIPILPSADITTTTPTDQPIDPFAVGVIDLDGGH